jgi:hypothetical protein
MNCVSWDVSIGIVTGYRRDDQSSIPAGDRAISFRRHVELDSLLSNEYGGLIRNTKGYGDKTHKTDSQNSYTTAHSG